MPNILDAIASTRPSTFKEQARREYAPCTRKARPSLANALRKTRARAASIIAELKKASPSRGVFACDDVVQRLRAYEESGVQGLSILTEPTKFNGSFDDLHCAVESTALPILCKDFIVVSGQLDLASKIGANAALIIAKLDASLALAGKCLELGMEPVIEIHDEDDLAKIVTFVKRHPKKCIVGINNRDLATLEINIGTTTRMLPVAKKALGDNVIMISESGIESPSDARVLTKAGVDGFLIGTAFMKTPVPAIPGTIKEMLLACRRGA